MIFLYFAIIWENDEMMQMMNRYFFKRLRVVIECSAHSIIHHPLISRSLVGEYF